jgi:hypothetical protein
MDFPEKIRKRAFEAALSSGNVLCYEISFPDGGCKWKRLIIVSNNNEKTILMLTTTSNKWAQSRSFGCDDIYIADYTVEGFEKPTYIQMNRVFEINNSDLCALFNKGKLEIRQKISEELLKLVISNVQSSELIESRYIRRIIAENSALLED